MKILLISANTLTEPYPVYPLGLDYVAGAIKNQHEVQIADVHTHNGEQLTDKIRQFSPDIVGISLRNVDNTDSTNPQGFIPFYRSLIDVVRKHTRALIVLGGSGLTIFPQEMMHALNADFGIMGEGERISQLLDALQHHKDVSTLPGIITRNVSKPIPAPWKKNISRDFNQKAFHLEFYLKNGGMLNIQTKRGCHFNCIYCTYPHIEGRKLRLIDPEAVAETAKQLETAGAKYLYITDAVFNSDSAHNIAVAKAFKKNRLSIPWGAFFAPIEPPPDYYAILADSGLSHVEFGTESLSSRVLTSYRKPFGVNHILAAHGAALEAGLYVAHYFLLGGPGENSETLDETLSNIDKLDKAVIILFCGMRVYPFTPLFDIALKNGQISATDSLLEPVFYRSDAIETAEIIRRVKKSGLNRPNWVIGTGSAKTAKIITRLYQHGHTGPLWEYLI